LLSFVAHPLLYITAERAPAFESFIRRNRAMRKYITSFVMMAMMAVMIPFFATSADAQTRRYSNRTYTTRTYRKPNVYQRHRNLINIGIGTGAGALLGALIGGKKGALIGAAAGAGGSALYTYKLNPKTKRYYRVRR
jgi:outer membrane lipoprotein SlyB